MVTILQYFGQIFIDSVTAPSLSRFFVLEAELQICIHTLFVQGAGPQICIHTHFVLSVNRVSEPFKKSKIFETVYSSLGVMLKKMKKTKSIS
jgi:hypothetical protein